MKNIKNWNDCSKNDGVWQDLQRKGSFDFGLFKNGYYDQQRFDDCRRLMTQFSSDITKYENLGLWHNTLNIESNQKILIIGAGPSTEFLKEEDIKNADQIWTCNHFFLYEPIRKLDINLVNVGNDVSPLESKLLQFLNERVDCKIVFANEMLPPRIKLAQELQRKYKDRFGFFFTRWVGKSGEVPKMLLWAALLKAKEISVIGMDGHTERDMRYKISGNIFQPTKPLVKKVYNWHMQRIQYVVLFDLLRENFPDIVLRNLGSRYKDNQITFLNENGEFAE